jgi:hypothetical protein
LVAASRSDTEDFEADETARISWDKHTGKPSSFSIIILISESVLADTRYTFYITNQRFLFNGEMKLYRRSIQVGGGKLYSKRIRIIIIKLANKRFIFLENSLFIPRLKYMFVLVKKLIRNQLISQFDRDRM